MGTQKRTLTGKPLLYFTSCFVSLGVFLFGYDQGLYSGLIVGENFKDYFDNPSAAQIGTTVAILEVGAFLSSLCVGRIGDKFGRNRTIFYGSIFFCIGGSLQWLSTDLVHLIIGRFCCGLGIGLLSTIIPVYQTEVSPPNNRGKLACLQFTFNISGYASSLLLSYACSFIEGHNSWRIPLGMQVVIGVLLAFGTFLVPESPRWLLDTDHDEEGMVVLANLHGGGDVDHPKARHEFKEIKESVLIERMEGQRSYRDMFRKYKKRLFIAMSSMLFAQMNGINVISYYAPYVFEEAGWRGRDSILMASINGLVYTASTVPPWVLIDRWGRRFILLSGAAAMTVALSLVSYFMYLDITSTPTLVVVFVIIYNAAFGYSWGPVPWLIPSEILPLSVRAKGASLSTATNWVFNWLVGEMTPILQEQIHWRLYLIPAFSCVCSFITVYFMYPETKGLTLEEMGSVFGDKSIMSRRESRNVKDTTALLHPDDEAVFDEDADEEATLMGSHHHHGSGSWSRRGRTMDTNNAIRGENSEAANSPIRQPSAAAQARRARSRSATPQHLASSPAFSSVPQDEESELGGSSSKKFSSK